MVNMLLKLDLRLRVCNAWDLKSTFPVAAQNETRGPTLVYTCILKLI